MKIDPGLKNMEKVSGCFSRYLMESKDIISSICFNLEKESIQIVSFNGQNLTFLLSVREVYVYLHL